MTISCAFQAEVRFYWLKVYEVPQGSRVSKGKPIVNLFPLMPGEKINATLVVKDFVDDKFIFMATSKGTVKKLRYQIFQIQGRMELLQ